MKLTKSLPVIKERNCSASLVLDCRTQRKNATEFPLAMRFTIDRKFFYYVVGSTYTEKQFSDICNATKSASENYREQRMWRETIVPKYKNLLAELNKGSLFTYEMVRVAVTTGNTSLQTKDDRSFMSIWEKIIHDLKTNDGGTQFTTGQNYEYALKSFRKIIGYDAITGFNISVAEIQKWKDGMKHGVKGKGGKLIGKISDTTAGIYLRACRAVWNTCIREGFLKDVPGWTKSIMRFFNGTSPSNHLELGVATPLPPTFITQVWKWITSQRAWDIQLANMPSRISILIHILWRNRWNTTPSYWI